MTTQQTERELLRWLAGLVNDNFNDGDTVTVDGETRTIGDLLDAANQALEPLTADQQEDLDRSPVVTISADSASVLFGNFIAIEQAVEILHNKGYSSSVEGLNALLHELESLKKLHATAPLLATIAAQGETLEAARKDSERLDYVMSVGCWVETKKTDAGGVTYQLWTQDEDENYSTLHAEAQFFTSHRAAIDAALISQKAEG